ncbi:MULTISPECIES: RNA polymerase sigma factor [Flammeovirga]|uniref:RNA polymerase sigma factor n=1 Tax=Flammeovirga aprica JL-4 TaxID=694437 RepID=A0A7X9S1K2_9BACT|nr:MULTISPECIES: RNA polymerase sigma factor [Flammeovirga]KXX67884.1 RNA polymerase subunit sigma-24 [Flammeovirga sp. SJP92]NME72472.1 RNA polymerase sigma factor [Flammeovirga aprica JL-4]
MKHYTLSDQELIAQYLNGSEAAFEQLLNKYKNKLFTSILLIVKDEYVAEDLLQDTFIKAIKMIRAGKYNEEGKFMPWISRIAHNMAIDYFRKQKRYPTIIMEDGSSVFDTLDFSETSIEDQRILLETQTNVRNLVDRLPDTQREVLVMRHYMEMSFQEIADSTDVSINTALGRMRYALINLRKMMEQQSENSNNAVRQKTSKQRVF